MERGVIFRMLLVMVLTLWGSPAAAQVDPAIEAEARVIFQAVMSPFCPGRSLQDCPSGKAAELKNEIREKLLSGRQREEILEDLFAVYGDQISAVPRSSGFGAIAWYTPLLFFIVGVLLIILWLQLRRAPAEARSPSAPIDPEMQARIDDELSD